VNIWLAWFDSYDEKARTADNSGSDSGSGSGPGSGLGPDYDSNLDLPYATELGFGLEVMDMSEKDRKDLAV
jgi:hypothetical protein